MTATGRSDVGVDPDAHVKGPGQEWRAGLKPEHEEMLSAWENHPAAVGTGAARSRFRELISTAPPVEGPVYRGDNVKDSYGYKSRIEAKLPVGGTVHFPRWSSTTARPEVAGGFGHVVYEIHGHNARGIGNTLHEAVMPPGKYKIHSAEWRTSPTRAIIDGRTMHDSEHLHVLLHPAESERTAVRYSGREVTHDDGRAIGPHDELTLYHETSAERAAHLRQHGTSQTKPVGARTVDNDYEPGRGMGKGLYLMHTPHAAGGVFGDTVLPVRVRAGDLAVPPERAHRIPHGMTPLRSLMVGDGYTEAELPHHAFGEPIRRESARSPKWFTGVPVKYPDGPTYYHGHGSDRPRADTGMPDWDNNLFVTHDPTLAREYGPKVDRIQMAPDTRVKRHEGQGKWLERLQKAKAEGYDVAEFHQPHDFVGHVIINRSKIVSREPMDRPMDRPHQASRQDDHSICPCGTPAEFDSIDGWQHADGSASHDGEFHGKSVSDLMHVAVLGPITPASGTITGSHLPYDATYQAAGETHYLHREPRGVHARTGEGRLSGFLGWDDQGQVGSVHVHEDYRRHGLASALWEHAKAVEPDLHHSTTLSGDGAAWARHTGVGRGDVMTRMHPRDLMPHVGDFDLDHNLVDSMRQHGWDPGKGKAFLRQRGQFHEDENPVTLWHTDRGSYVEPGNHRVPAADAAGLDSIPVLVKDRRTKPPVTARFTPDKRVFTHTDGLDHRLFDGEHLRPEVRSDVLARFTRFCAIRGYRNWSSWGRLVFFGSEASEWTSLSLEGNGDFDLSLGVDYPTFRQHNPAYDAMTDQEIAQMFTEQMHADLNDSQHFFAVTL